LSAVFILEMKQKTKTANPYPRLIIAFAGGGGALGMPVFEFRNFLINNFPDLHKVFVRDNSQVKGGQFYFLGMTISDNSETQYRNVESTSFEENLEILKKIINQSDYEKIIFLGNSSGAFAALLYGLLLNVDEVMAFGPYTVITQECLKNQNMPYSHVIERLWEHQPDHDYYDLYNIAKENDTTKVSIVYGSRCLFDKKQAKHLQDLPNIFISCAEGANHVDCIKAYRNNGVLKKMIEEAIVSYNLLAE